MANYRVNQTNKTVIIDMNKVTDNEMKLIQTYASAGYLLKEKKKGLTYKDMENGLKNNPEQLEVLRSLKAANKNYMEIMKWYKGTIKDSETKAAAKTTKSKSK
jgi:hypothetical protein